MKLNCPISGLEYRCSYMQASAAIPHPFIASAIKKLPAQLSLFQQQQLDTAECHLLYCTLLLNTEHVVFHSPLWLTPELAQVEAAQMKALAQLAFSGCFQKSSIELPGFCISEEVQDVSNLIAIWEEELESYRISALLARQEHEARAMLTRVQRAFSTPYMKQRKLVITSWMQKVVSLPSFHTVHPISGASISCAAYWIELLHKAIDGDMMLQYPEKDLYEFKTHLEENLPMNYAQEFSLLEEIQMAITRKQNYFGYSFVDSNDTSYSIAEIKPALKRSDFSSISEYLNAIKMNRKA